MIGAVEGWSRQVIHCRIHDDEVLFLTFLGIEAFRRQNPGVAHQVPARLEEEMETEVSCLFHDGLPVLKGEGGLLFAVTDPEPSSQIEIPYFNSHLPKSRYETFQLFDGVYKGGYLGELAADMAIHPQDVQVFHLHRPLVLGKGAFYVDAELCLLEAGGYVWMGLGVYVGIDANGNPRLFP